jgi:hypothetical protein
MAITDFSVNKLRFWAVTLGFEIELIRVELDYMLSGIPTAILSCAVGRDVKTLEAATIHFLVSEMDVNVPIVVYCEAFEAANSGISGGEFPVGPFVVFDGRIVGIDYTKSRSGTAALALRCRNFLMDLEYALTNLKTTHPRNPNDGKMNCGIQGDSDDQNFVIQSTATTLFTRTNIEEDLWGDAIQPWLAKILELPAVFEGEDISEGQGQADALEALYSIEPFGGEDEDEYEFGVPLELDDFDVLNSDAAIQAIAGDAAKSTFESFSSTTIYEKIAKEFGGKFMYGLVPMAQRALVVPFIPGLRELWLIIDPDSYETIELDTELPRGLRGVVVYTGMNSMCGALGFMEGQEGAMRSVGGIFENEDVDPGMYIFCEGPLWLSNAVSPPWWALPALGVGRKKGNAMNPGEGDGPRDGVNPKDVRFAADTMWDAFAHAKYLLEALRLRRGSLAGKMRFDIAPGSSIGVITTEEKFVSEQVGFADEILYGMVTRVKIIYDSDAARGQTNIEFGWIRNSSENETDMATDDHPLYATTFDGAPLCEEQPV